MKDFVALERHFGSGAAWVRLSYVEYVRFRIGTDRRLCVVIGVFVLAIDS